MVQALIELDENTNRVLNVVKAKFDLKDKGDAIKLVVEKFVDYENEPELRLDFIQKFNEMQKKKTIKVDDFAKRYGLN